MSRRPKNLTAAEKTEFIQMYLGGYSAKKIGELRDVHKSTVEKLLKRENVVIRPASEEARKYTLNEDFFDNIDTELRAYFLGFIAGDGGIHRGRRVRLVLAMRDFAHLEKFKAALGSGAPITIRESLLSNGKTYRAGEIALYSAKLVSALAKYGVTEKKSFTYDPVLNFDPSLHRHFFRGLTDADGSLPKNKNGTATLSLVGSLKTCEKYKAYIDSLDSSSAAKVLKHKSIFGYSISKKSVVEAAITDLYVGSTIFLDRKKERALSILKNKFGKDHAS